MRWWWVRHAPAAMTTEERAGFCGWSDPAADLSDEHFLAALRSAIPEEAALVSSDLKRAAQTADALARRNMRRLPAEANLREQHFGDWEGLSYTAPETKDFWRAPALAAPPNGESFAEVCDRVGRVIDRLNASDEAEIIAVAHAGAIRAALAYALNMPPSQALSFEITPLSLTRIDWIAEPKAWRIGGVNFSL